jgi:ATP-binding cassette subfamily C protein
MQTLESNSFEEICATLGQSLVVSGNQPFLLNEPDSFWLVQRGRVEIFAVQVKQGQPSEARHHVCSVLAGQIFPGVNSDEYGEGFGLLAVASVNTGLLRLPMSALHDMAAQPHLAAHVSALLDDWVEALSEDITRETLVERDLLLLEPDTTLNLESWQKIGVKKKGLWLNIADGQGVFLGQEEVTLPSPRSYFPLYSKSWLQFTTPGRVSAAATREVIANPGLWEGLDVFYTLFFRAKATNIRLETYDEINRLRTKAEYDLTASQTALNLLASVIETGDKRQRSAETGPASKNKLLAACQLVGKAGGIAIQPPPKSGEKKAQALNTQLDEIARASRMRTRQVTLETGWWAKDGGPLLGFMSENDSPVALLPLSSTSYELVDPALGRQVQITEEIAATLDPTAYVFYRPFPEKVLRARDLVTFGLRGTRNALTATLVLGGVGGLLALFVPLFTGYLFDTVIPSGQRSALLQILVGLLVVAFTGAAFQFTRAVAILRLETQLGNSLQAAVWDRLLSLPPTFFRDYSVGDLAVRAMGIDQIRQLVGSNVITAILGSIFSIFSLVLLFTFGLPLALAAVGLTLITLGMIALVSLRQLRYQRRLAEVQGRIAGMVLQMISGIAKLRVAGAEVRAFAVWAKEFAGQRRLAFKVRTTGYWLTVFNAAWPVITLVAIFGTVAGQKNQNLSTGQFLTYLAAFTQFLAAMIGMATALTTVLRAIPVYERSKVILESLPEATSLKADPGELSGAIEINHLSFRYNPDSPLILNDISLQIKPGQFVAVVGPSGSGKSSLFRLLLGFESPEAGSIYYDNQDLAGLDVQRVRRQVGVVLQNGKLMAGDVFTNIVGSAPFSFEDAWEAARLAGIAKDIEAMPMGMFTLVSEGGSTLSGGQRQRLMIARAIIAKPRILLFDEATSALDNQTQAIVSQSLENLQATRIVIAHRLSTIVNADCIYVLQGGKIAQAGTYAELMQQDGPFKELASRQLA